MMPVLDEIDGLRAILDKIDRSWVDEVLIVDGGSTDGSREYAESQGYRVIRQKRPGLVGAVIDGIETCNTDYVIEFSPDGNCRVEDLPALLEKMSEGFDIVVVSRYLPPAKSDDDTFVTAFGNWVFTKLISLLGPNRVTDSLNIYRGFRIDRVCNDWFFLNLKGPVLEPLTTCVAQLYGLKYTEIPGDEPPRIGGERKMRILYNGACILLLILRSYAHKLGRAIGRGSATK